MAEVAEAPVAVVAPVAHEEVFAVAHIFASFNDTFVVSILSSLFTFSSFVLFASSGCWVVSVSLRICRESMHTCPLISAIETFCVNLLLLTAHDAS